MKFYHILSVLAQASLIYPDHLAYSFILQTSSSFNIRDHQHSNRGWMMSQNLENTGEGNVVETNGIMIPHISFQSRLNRIEQIGKLQGVWWTSEKKEQLVEINSSYAIFDAPQNIPDAADTSHPAILYPLGGSDDIVTLRSSKLVQLSPIPQWASSPTSRNKGIISSWKKCIDPEKYWKTNVKKSIPGYEEALVNLLFGGRHWSSSPVDVVRAFIMGCQSNYFRKNTETFLALCRCRSFENPSQFYTVSSWSIVKSKFFSQDVCVIAVKVSDDKYFDFCLTREYATRSSDEKNQPHEPKSKLPPSMLYASVMDVELCLSGKSWVIDHIQESSCSNLRHK